MECSLDLGNFNRKKKKKKTTSSLEILVEGNHYFTHTVVALGIQENDGDMDWGYFLFRVGEGLPQ